jgi:hypothetical protein
MQHLESNGKLHDAQHGFRPNRSAIDNIFMLTQVINARKYSKQDTYLLFLDIEKAYDSVWRAGLLYHLWNKGITGKMFRTLAQMTDNPSSMVFHKDAFSAAFQPGMGWEQGDTLATTMFNVHIDAVLQHVWAEHAGVPVPSTLDNGQDSKLVALMYADDLAGVASSPTDLNALVQSIRAALTTWRLKASVKPGDGSKTAIMVIKASNARTVNTTAHTWSWGNVQIPQVDTYRYLGAHLSHTGKWEEHITKRMSKASAAAGAQHGIMGQNKLPWHLRHLTLTSVVQPVMTYACQVWGRCTKTQRSRLDTWQTDIVKRMVHCPATTSTACLQQELGILPVHMACDIWTLCYWHRLRKMSSDRILQQIFSAWTDAHNPWQQNINKLIQEYNIDTVTSMSYGKDKFAKYSKLLATDLLQQQWQHLSTTRHSRVCTHYEQAYNIGEISNGIGGMHPTARDYFVKLSNIGRGWPAELCLKLRTESMPLKCMHNSIRKNETITSQNTRQRCPVCKQAPETPVHFLLECPHYSHLRHVMLQHLMASCPQIVAEVHADTNNWRLLLQDSILMPPSTTATSSVQMGSAFPVADFVVGAWTIRSTALAGRETNGGNAMVSGLHG